LGPWPMGCCLLCRELMSPTMHGEVLMEQQDR